MKTDFEMNLEGWNNHFYQDRESTVQLGGVSYARKDFLVEDETFHLRDTDRYFIIPWHYNTETNTILETKCARLNDLSSLGLRAAKFELVPMTFIGSDNKSFTVNVIEKTSLKSLCEAESLIIYADNKITGDTEALKKLRINFSFRESLKKMLRLFYQDYITGVSYQLPHFDLQRIQIEGSEDYCLELPKSAGEIPQMRYMFLDVTANFSGITFPKVPLLQELNTTDNPEKSLELHAEMLANAFTKMIYGSSINNDFYDSTEILIKDILAKDKDLFTAAIEHSRAKVTEYYTELMSQSSEEKLKEMISPPGELVRLVCGVVSTDNLRLVNRALQHISYASIPLIQQFDTIIDTAKKYANDAIIKRLQTVRIQVISFYLKKKAVIEQLGKDDFEFAYLLKMAMSTNNTKLVTQVLKTRSSFDLKTMKQIEGIVTKSQRPPSDPIILHIKKHLKENLKSKFVGSYQKQLRADKQKICGLFRFFSKSNLSSNDTLEDMIKHAKGLSGKGTGLRSRTVMKDLGWLNESNEHNGELQDSQWLFNK